MCKISRSIEKPSYTLHDMLCGAVGLAISGIALTLFFCFILSLFIEAMRP